MERKCFLYILAVKRDERAKEEDKKITSFSLHQSGIIEQKKGNCEEAERLYKERLKLKKERGDREGIAKSLYNLGKIQQGSKNYNEAIRALSEAASIFEELV